EKFVLKYGAQFVSNDGGIERAFDFFQGGLGADTYAYEVERETFDHLLLKNAIKHGAEAREATNVLDVETGADRPCRLRLRRDDILSVGAVANIADWKATGIPPEAYFEKAVQSSPYVASRVKPGVRVGEFYTASNYSYTSKRFAGDGYLLAGDAAEFLDPIF